MGELSDERLQDYVDGRLAERERAEVEARLAEDADLARRVAFWREVGRALRAPAEELPPGFYARARARFQRERTRGPAGWRLLSWETAGLAAAAALAAALFVPELLHRRDAPVAERRHAADDTLDRAEPQPKDEARAEPEGFAPVPPAEPTAPARERAASKPAQPPAPSVAPAAAPPVEAKKNEQAAPIRQDAAAEAYGQELPPRLTRSASEKELHEALQAAAIDVGPVVSLPAGVLPAGALRVVTSETEWAAWGAGPAGGALATLGGHDPRTRLVLVGRAATDCGSWSVTREEGGYRVQPGSAGAAAGCAFLLPRDGRPVAIDNRGSQD